MTRTRIIATAIRAQPRAAQRPAAVAGSAHDSARAAIGKRLPDIELSFLPECRANLATLASRHAMVLCFYPMLTLRSNPWQEEHTARALRWAQNLPTLQALDHQLVAIVSQGADSLLEWAFQLDVSHMLLSDADLHLARALALPTRHAENRPARKPVYEPATLLVRSGRVARVFHPAGPADAAIATDWIRRTYRA